MACACKPAASLATIATPEPVNTRKCVAAWAPSTNEIFPVSLSPRHSTRPAAASPSKAPSATATAALPRWRSLSSARAALDGRLASARLAATAPSSGAGQEARPSSSNTSRISRRPVSEASAPSVASPLAGHLAPQRRDRLGVAGVLHGGGGRPAPREQDRAPICATARARRRTRFRLRETCWHSWRNWNPDYSAPLCAENLIRFKAVGAAEGAFCAGVVCLIPRSPWRTLSATGGSAMSLAEARPAAAPQQVPTADELVARARARAEAARARRSRPSATATFRRSRWTNTSPPA